MRIFPFFRFGTTAVRTTVGTVSHPDELSSSMPSFPYTFGIEEEYFLASSGSRNLANRVPRKLLADAKTALGDAVTAELLQSQIEIASPILHDCSEALAVMTRLRQGLADVVREKGLRLIAASTHPLGAWREQVVTEKPRYDELMSDFRIIGQRNLVCGMHVHVGIPPGVDRVALMNRAMPWLPLFLALSTSSPFWNRKITGLLSYRQAVYDEWPRSGIPDFFADQPDYDAFIALMQKAGAVRDASYFWWAMRPALRFPTLEMRIADVCTRVEDGVAIASLFRCLIAALIRHPEVGSVRTTHTRRIVDENRWRAKRDGTAASFIDEATSSAIPLADRLQSLLEFVAEDAEELGCTPTLRRLPQIVADGTSAHAQLRIYNERRAGGASNHLALQAVVDWLASTTADGAAAANVPVAEAVSTGSLAGT
jgi:glutamate---cysteine ligase / carboxylate-amine ligase